MIITKGNLKEFQSVMYRANIKFRSRDFNKCGVLRDAKGRHHTDSHCSNLQAETENQQLLQRVKLCEGSLSLLTKLL